MSRMEEFFKSKIDWKFYNYLVDKLTLYEDKTGYSFSISVCVDTSPNFVDGYYIYNPYRLEIGDQSCYDDKVDNIDGYVKLYNRNGLFYNIEMKYDFMTYEEKLKQIDITFIYIQDKAVKVNSTLSWLVVKPK